MDSFIQIVECLFSNVWAMVTSVEYPGTGVPIAAIFIGTFLICLVIRVIVFIFDSQGGGKE